MQVIKTLDTNNHTYYYGYISKYDKTEAEKKRSMQLLLKRLGGIAIIVIAALSTKLINIDPEFGMFTVLLGFTSLPFIFCK